MASPLTATLTMFSIQVGFPVAGILVADKMFKRTKRTRKFRYGVAITAFAFGGWVLSNYFTEKYLENVEITLEAEGEDVVLDWFDTNLVGRTPYDVKDNDARIIMLDYALPVREIEGLFSESKMYSTYPEEQAKPIVYEPMMKEGLEDIEFELDEALKMSDGHYFVSRNVPNTNRSEKSELIFFTMSGDGRKKPLRIFQLATTMY